LGPAGSATGTTTTAGARRSSRGLGGGVDSGEPGIRYQRVGKAYGAVRLLAVFEQGDEATRECHAGRVERVHESRSGVGLGPIADVGPPCLIIGERAGAGDLEPR